jgi:hypothetical protein
MTGLLSAYQSLVTADELKADPDQASAAAKQYRRAAALCGGLSGKSPIRSAGYICGAESGAENPC